MKRIAILIWMILPALSLFAQTNGILNVSVTTASTGGSYAPRHVFVIWIEDASGNFVKTLSAYADRRIQYLYTWSASTSAKNSLYNRVDAVTGATLNSHGTRTGTWNGTDYNKNPVIDGTYYVCMELTDKHAQGNYSRFAFTKGASAKITPANTTGFSSVTIDWVASGTTAVEVVESNDDIQIFPNPSGNLFRVQGTGILKIEVLTMAGNLLFTSENSSEIDLGNTDSGVYLVRIKTNDKTVIKKLVKE